ncbi:MAG TPA: hypothetical protein VHV10_02270 [Ktedonobacteraceae bacterium]|nr:hypothetical protein [Ktedonobacteraceae bacterium]
MAIWSGIGLNYGHQQVYDVPQVENDFTYLKSQGVTRLRIAMPTYDAQSHFFTDGHDMVQRALAHGFYTTWGVGAGYGAGTITASRWAAWKAYITGTLVPWAQSAGLSELLLGNESDMQMDGTTITATTMRADIRALATSIKANGYTGKLSYSTGSPGTYRTPWSTEGIGDLDLIGFNSYDVFSNFNNRNVAIVSEFGNRGYISEFCSITNGYSDYNDETLWYNDVVARISNMKNTGIASGYFFCYRDGGYGLQPNTYALVKTDGGIRLARNAVLGL